MSVYPSHTWQVVIQQGDDHPIVIPVIDRATRQPIDCTGWAARSQVRDDAGALVHTWDTADESAVCGPDGVSLLTNDSVGWSWAGATYRFDVVATDPIAGVQVVPGRGTIRVIPLLTQLAAP